LNFSDFEKQMKKKELFRQKFFADPFGWEFFHVDCLPKNIFFS